MQHRELEGTGQDIVRLVEMDAAAGEVVEHIAVGAAGGMSVHTAEAAVGYTAGIETGRIEAIVAGGNIAAAADYAAEMAADRTVETAADRTVRTVAGRTVEAVGDHIVVAVAVGTAADIDCTHMLEKVADRRSIETP